MNQNNFNLQNDELLEYILTTKFFNNFKDIPANEKVGLELYITPTCNQKCDYCYLVKYENELYPKEINDEKLILQNLEILLDWFLENEFVIPELDIFSGEIWGKPLGNKIFDIILNYIKKGLKINLISIPSNCSFVLKDQELNSMRNYWNKFKNYNIHLNISASVDGLILDKQFRSFKDESLNNLRNTEFYNKLISFITEIKGGFHPMICAQSVDEWIENYKWWDSQLKLFNKSASQIMTLEVRNDDWTNQNIIDLFKFLNFIIDTQTKEFNGFENYLKQVLLAKEGEYAFYKIERLAIQRPKTPSCTINHFMSIRLGDLAICPCHRLSYNKLLYGWFKISNNKIVGIKANNVMLANKILLGSCKNTIECNVCPYVDTCMRGCLGTQYEKNDDPLINCKSVCGLIKAKTVFLIEKYRQLNCLDILINNKILEKIIKTKEYQEWQPIAAQIIQLANQNQ